MEWSCYEQMLRSNSDLARFSASYFGLQFIKVLFLFERCMPFIYFRSGGLAIYISLDTNNPNVRYVELTSDYYEEVIEKYMCEIK